MGLRRRKLLYLTSVGLLRLPIAIARAWRRCCGADLVYLSTTVIADYIIAARFFPSKGLLHIHETPLGISRIVLRALVKWSRTEVIFNSHATQTCFALGESVTKHVIYNGITGPASPEAVTYDGSRPLRLLMLGRINFPNKGQGVLLAALAAMPETLRARIEVRIVGGAFEDPYQERALPLLVHEMGLADIVVVEPFTADPAPLYRWADVVVVPSRRVEYSGAWRSRLWRLGGPWSQRGSAVWWRWWRMATRAGWCHPIGPWSSRMFCATLSRNRLPGAASRRLRANGT